MIKILIIADDFTGAMDTGVKFSAVGAETKVVMDTEQDFHEEMAQEVLVLCTLTRHLPAGEAYEKIRRITERAVSAGIGCIFKKTDSALRGNIGAELNAVLDGSKGRALHFIPALPTMNRITKDGTHYIDNLPVAESVFGKDPFAPVTESYVPDLLHLQCDKPVRVVSCEESENFRPGEETCIYVFDCVSQEEMERKLGILGSQGQLRLLAGCAGLAESLPPYLGLKRDTVRGQVWSCHRMTVICGSVNPISSEQMDYGERYGGYRRVHIPAEWIHEEESFDGDAKMEALWETCRLSGRMIIDSLQEGGEPLLRETTELTLEDIRRKMSGRMGQILKGLIDRGLASPILIIGGDTLLAFLESIQCRTLTPICEPQPGVVLFRVGYRGREYEILAKSGGFGEPDLFLQLLGETKALAD